MPEPRKPYHRSFKFEYHRKVRDLQTPAYISLPACVRNGAPPSSKEYTAIWDTGATNSVITREVIDDLGLLPTGKVPVSGVNSTDEVNTYFVDVILPNRVLIEMVSVTECLINSLGGAQVLIGMDIIQHGDFSISNHNGETVFSFCIPPHENRIDLLEKSICVNKRNKYPDSSAQKI